MAAAQSKRDRKDRRPAREPDEPDTSSRPDDDNDDEDRVESGTASSLPKAVVVPPKGDAAALDPVRWIRRGVFVGVLAIGWLFILYVNRFTYSAPTVFVCLAYLALVSTGYALWRSGVVIVTEDDEEGDSTWGRPTGRRTELEREKKTLLKAIKEAEFDREMGKLSKADAEEMIAVYRVRAIEVIKERELKARLELDVKATKAMKDAKGEAARDRKRGGPVARAPMPGKLMLVMGLLALGLIANFLEQSFIAVAFYGVMLAGIALGSNSVRTFLRGFAVVAIVLLLILAAPAFDRLGGRGFAIIAFSILSWGLVIWSLGQEDVREWMFRTTFKIDPDEDLVNKAVDAALNTPGTKVSVSVNSETGAIDVKSNAASETADSANDTANSANDTAKESTDSSKEAS
jgi:hypothetical protein